MYNQYYCQLCGCESKLIHQLMYDEVCIDEDGVGTYNGLTDDFDNLGIETCYKCGKEWTGAELISTE
jgi:hypothetical protein